MCKIQRAAAAAVAGLPILGTRRRGAAAEAGASARRTGRPRYECGVVRCAPREVGVPHGGDGGAAAAAHGVGVAGEFAPPAHGDVSHPGRLTGREPPGVSAGHTVEVAQRISRQAMSSQTLP